MHPTQADQFVQAITWHARITAAHEQVEIFAVVHGFVEPAQRLEDCTAKEPTADVRAGVFHEIRVRSIIFRPRDLRHFRRPEVVRQCRRRCRCCGLRHEDRHLPFQSLRQEQIVSIEKGDQITASVAQPVVARRGDAGLLLLAIDHVRGKAAGDGGGLIRRAIIHNDDLVGRARLHEHAFDRVRQVSLAVVDGDDDANAQAVGVVRWVAHASSFANTGSPTSWWYNASNASAYAWTPKAVRARTRPASPHAAVALRIGAAPR